MVPNMALAGVMVEVFSARSRAPMTAFKAETVLPVFVPLVMGLGFHGRKSR